MPDPDFQHLLAANKEAFFALSLLADRFPEGSPDRELCETTKRSLRNSFNRTFHPDNLIQVPGRP